MFRLRAFQKQFVRGALAPDVDTAALSIPRGNGKSWLAAYLLERCMTPGDPLHIPGAEYLLCAASIEQARLCYRFVRAALEPVGGYRFIDSTTRLGITHLPSNTKLRVLSSNGKTGMGIVGCPLAVCDEPGSWEINGGQLMADALLEAQGKPQDFDLRLVFIGTLAPMATLPGHWWHDLAMGGSHDSTYTQTLQGDRARWDDWREIRRCNPLVNLPGKPGARLRKKLKQRRAEAWADSRLKARFLNYRLNVPAKDESTMLLSVDDWKMVLARPVPPREGEPIVGIDLGAGRAWSAAVALWQNGRVEALAIASGIPSIVEQEKRDRVPAGTYQKLVDNGSLHVAHGLRVQPPSQLIKEAKETWGRLRGISCDFFRINDLRDCTRGIQVVGRRTRWSESSEDIRALRQQIKDGDIAVYGKARGLLTASLARAMVQPDDSGNVRLIKAASNNVARDDVSSALVQAVGARSRLPKNSGGIYLGLVA